MRRFYSTLLASVITINCLVVGCSSSDDNSTQTGMTTESVADAADNDPVFQEHIPGKTGYRETILEIEPYAEALDCSVCYVDYIDGYYYDIVKFNNTTNGYADSVKLYKVSDDGDVVSITDLEHPFCYDYIITEDRIVGYDNRQFDFFSLEDGSHIGSAVCPAYGMDISPYEDGFVFLQQGCIINYDIDGNELGRVTDDQIMLDGHGKTFFVIDDTPYVMCFNANYWNFYEVDFNSETIRLAGDTNRMELDFFFDCYGDCVFDHRGGYRIDLENYEKNYFVTWDNTNVKPDIYNSATYELIDADRFVIYPEYISRTEPVSIQMYQYDSSIDYSDRTILTVGGVDISDDYALNYAVYKYNTSQDEYRMVINDIVYISAGHADDAVFNAELTASFVSGGAPDVFYGDFFDYEYFGRNDMCIDMLPYLQSSDVFDPSELYESVWNVMAHDGVCYQIFTGFSMQGYYARTDLGLDSNMTYDEMFSLRDDIYSIIPPAYSRNIASSIVGNSLGTLVDENGNFIVSEEDMRDIVSVALTVGAPDTGYCSYVEEGIGCLRNESYMLYETGEHSITWYNQDCIDAGGNLQYIGFPTVNGSAHLIFVTGNSAVSSGTSHPQACVDFLTYLFDYDLQSQLMSRGGSNTVLKQLDQDFFDYILSDASEYNAQFDSMLEHSRRITEDTIEAYLDCINEIDGVYYIDNAIYSIITEEIATYDTQGRSPELIANSLYERLNLYVEQNY